MGDGKFKITDRRNPTLQNKLSTFKLIDDSDIGGQRYIDADHLFKNPRESETSYKARKERAVYINVFAPLLNMVVGQVFKIEPIRTDIDEYHPDSIYMRKWGIDRLMKKVCRSLLMYTCGILVDSPRNPEQEELSAKEAEDKRMHPYVKFVRYDQILDFAFDTFGNLEWVMIDNSQIIRSDPIQPDRKEKQVRIWYKDGYQDIQINDKEEETLKAKEVIPGMSEIPFRMLNMIDNDDDGVAESYCEDIAFALRAVYNYISLIDEQLYGGAISVCFFPGYDEGKEGAIKAWGVVGTNPGEQLPEFKKPQMSDVEIYITWIDWLVTYAQNKLGAGTDKEKDYTQSGKAKQIDLEKIKSIISSLITELQETENWIYRMCKMYDPAIKTNASVSYNQNFKEEDLSEAINGLREIMLMPYKIAVAKARKLLIQKVMGNDLSTDEMKVISDEIDNTSQEKTA